MDRRGKPKKAQAKAKRALVRKSPKEPAGKVRDLEKRLAEALEQIQTSKRELAEAFERQTATSEILRIISSSPTDLQPVLDAVAERAASLCGASDGTIFRVDGDCLRLVAHHASIPAGPVGQYTLPLISGTVAGRTVLERRLIHVADLQQEVEEFPEGSTAARRFGHRTILSAPLLRDGAGVGCIQIRRPEVQPFTLKQVELLQTFADQAIIAIENGRLFTDLQEKNQALTQAHEQVSESLAQQTATSEILRAISSSPTDVHPVFDTIANSAMRLCDGNFGNVATYDGDLLHLVAHANVTAEGVEFTQRMFPMRPSRETVLGRVVLQKAVVHIRDAQADVEYLQPLRVALRGGSAIGIPILHGGEVVGSIAVGRSEPRPFTDKEIDLLKTFADQAAIAIENTRLFKELETRNRELTESLDRQTATADILRAISQAQVDPQPVFEAVVDSVVRLFAAWTATVYQYDGELLSMRAARGGLPGSADALRERLGVPHRPDHSPEEPVLTKRVRHVADVETDPSCSAEFRAIAAARGFRAFVSVPMLRGADPLGLVTVGRAEPGAFSAGEIALLQTFADQAAIAIENARLFNETKAALERQTATAEILRVISQSPTDVQPVFDAIVESAARLCGAAVGHLFQLDGDLLTLAAQYNSTPELDEAIRAFYPMRPTTGQVSGRAILSRMVVQIPDVFADPEYRADVAIAVGWRSRIGVPLLRDGRAIGVIVVNRVEAGAFANRHVELLQTFADQAVIAIENVRLFNETKETLEQRVATSEVLAVISRSPTDVQPVFETIAALARRLCNARECAVFRFDGELIHLVAQADVGAAWANALRSAFPRPPGRGSITARAILTHSLVHVPDALADPEYDLTEAARASGVRTALSIPMIREGQVIGAITVDRGEPEPFTGKQIELVTTFADQAVIAIENVRLFTELQTSNRELTTALDTQTATSDILRTISRSQTDVQPVFDAIVSSAVRLLGGFSGALTRVAGDQIVLAALTSSDDPDADAALRALFPHPVSSGAAHAQAIRSRAPFNIADAQADPGVHETVRAYAQSLAYHSQIVVPLLRHHEAIGALAVTRREPGGFTGDEIALLQTFADQAVIAIENARLLTELQARTAELTRSVGELTALGEIGRALSSTLDVDVVLDTIVARANDLVGADGCTIFEYDEAAEQFHLRATRNLEPRLVELARGTPLRKGDQGILGRLPTARRPVQVPDITDGSYSSPISDALIEAGYRAVVAVPLIREEHLVGALTMSRKTPGEFPRETIELLQTFATQSALAIQNARLFQEIEDKSGQLEAASRHKSEFLANMSHELRTPLNAIIGFSEVLSDRMFGELNEKQEEYLQDIHASGQHLLSLINDILDLSKIEAGRMELELTDFHLPTAIDNALILVRERAGRRGIRLSSTLDESLDTIRADERKVKQVLLNLLSNALKFTPEGGRIEVRAELNEAMVAISVTDTGVGIAPEDQEAIFEEFRQVGTADKKVEGTGLGLALSRKFVELHGGRIWVKSHVGEGSTFTFTLPMHREG